MLWSTVMLAVRAIRRNLMRAFLTILGIVIGVSAVVSMVTLGNGATRAVSDQISSLGSNLVMVNPGQRLGPGRETAGAPRFKVADATAIETQVGGLKGVAPTVSTSVTAVHMANNWSTSITGTTAPYFSISNWKLAGGRVFNEAEERAGKAVCVIGDTVRRELYGHQNPVGGELRIKQFACEVIGLLQAKGQGAMGMDQDNTVVMPLRTVQR
ncbi:MAG TPA: ABC transporter permease, partial [Candidatus Margulisiibacteriota bacterium]|nr:ABC transporter permease [Candidatus Margulisiibacteriota bacterium]